MELLCEMHYEYIIGAGIWMLSSLPALERVRCRTTVLKLIFTHDCKFTECMLGCRGKCGKHPGITATAVTGDVTQFMYKR